MNCICLIDVCFDNECPYCNELDQEWPCPKDSNQNDENLGESDQG